MNRKPLPAAIMVLALLAVLVPLVGCEEVTEGVDKNNDIIIRNVTSDQLWIAIDGVQRGSINEDGVARTMWDAIDNGVHTIVAYNDVGYTDVHCQITTDYLDDGEDFFWYLEDDDRYAGTKEGDCN